MTPQEQYDMLIRYCAMKLEQGDLHGIADAAMDLRDLAAKHPGLQHAIVVFVRPAD